MIHSLCAGYHWSYEEAMRRTLPQIIMLNYGAVIADEEAEIRVKSRREREQKKEEADPFIPEYGCRLSELQQNEGALDDYFASLAG